MKRSYRVPLLAGVLKIKPYVRLSYEERRSLVWRLGDMCFVWERPEGSKPAPKPEKGRKGRRRPG